MFKKKYWIPFSFAALFLGMVAWAYYQYGPATNAHEEDIIEHIGDSYVWHLVGEWILPLPLIFYHSKRGFFSCSSAHFLNHHGHIDSNKQYLGFQLSPEGITATDNQKGIIYDFSITKNVAAMLFSFVIILLLFGLLSFYMRRARYHKRKNILMEWKEVLPKGFAVIVLRYVKFIREIAKAQIGEEQFRSYVPFLLTLFTFILMNNLLGLLPGAANVTGNISITLALALYGFFITHLVARKSYWKHLVKPEGVPWLLVPLIMPIEIISTLLKPLVLSLRLFANIMAGHIMVHTMLSMGTLIQSVAAGLLISLTLGTFVTCLELVVAFIQAYVFTLLTAMNIGKAVHMPHSEE